MENMAGVVCMTSSMAGITGLVGMEGTIDVGGAEGVLGVRA